MANRTVSNGEFLAFIEDNGYERPELWLAEAWQRLQDGTLAKQPLYWRQQPDGWYEYRLDGLYRLDKARPVVHVSAFEAMAYAAWANARLLTKRNGNGQPGFIKAAVILLNPSNFIRSQVRRHSFLATFGNGRAAVMRPIPVISR